MKGRPLEPAELQMMLEAVPEVFPNHVAEWTHYLNGLWLSGLRRSESLILSWDSDTPFSIDQTGLYWKFRIRAKAPKSRKSQFCVIAPDFIEWLHESTPAAKRTGLVFSAIGHKGVRLTGSEAGRRVAEIGKAAGFETDPENGKFATCHDLRRSFGNRWAAQLMPADLKTLMRHESIETTMKYYVRSQTDELSARLQSKSWARTEVTETGSEEPEVTKKVTK